ncbi:MAG: alpha/beta hydrolase-fold protein [Bacteroidales bacterium]
MKRFLVLFFMIVATGSLAQIPNVSGGKIVHYENFNSVFVDPRNVDVWLPDGYSTEHRYAVIYMHDGQMLFDSTHTWNHQEWCVDETMTRLLKEKKIRNCIVVAIWNIPEKRFAEYFPEKVIDSIPLTARNTILAKQLKGSPRADNYLKFIVKELKPFIDRHYSTLKDASNTFLIGSSMGGLISLYALCEYPAIFGGAACLSIHSPLASFELIDQNTDKDIAVKFRNYLLKNLPKANSKLIYLDYGSLTGDAYYGPYQKALDSVMVKKGYTFPHWTTRYYPGEGHTEKSWSKRLDIPLEFLLKKE